MSAAGPPDRPLPRPSVPVQFSLLCRYRAAAKLRKKWVLFGNAKILCSLLHRRPSARPHATASGRKELWIANSINIWNSDIFYEKDTSLADTTKLEYTFPDSFHIHRRKLLATPGHTRYCIKHLHTKFGEIWQHWPTLLTSTCQHVYMSTLKCQHRLAGPYTLMVRELCRFLSFAVRWTTRIFYLYGWTDWNIYVDELASSVPISRHLPVLSTSNTFESELVTYDLDQQICHVISDVIKFVSSYWIILCC